MIKYGLTFHSVFEALEANNRNVGGGQVVTSGEALLVHGLGLATTVEQIGSIVVVTHDGTPVRVRDIGHVQIDHEIRRGAVTLRTAKGERVLGLGFMLMGENSHVVTRELKKQLAEAQKALPDDVRLEVLYERTDLIDKVIRTVEHNLLAGALLVIVVLFVFLGNLRAGLIVALAIPLSMLFAGSLMVQAGIAASLLSLGAIDFGLIVDSSVIMVENCVRRAAQRQDKPWMDTIRDAAIEVRKPTMFGELIIMIVFLPILALEGVEGKLFRPMALTMIFALLGSLVLSLSLMPVLASLVLPKKIKESEPWLVRLAHRAYAPILDLALRFRTTTLVGATVLVVLAAGVASRTGGEFLPKLSEGTLVVNVIRLAGVHVDEAAASNTLLERLILEEFPDEVERAWSRLGTAEIATDPMGIELTDIFLTLRPRAEWKRARTQQGLAAEIEGAMRDFPGINAVLTQPIEMRMNEMIAGIRSDIGIKIYGDDLETLRRLSDEVQEVLLDTPGAGEISGEQITGQPMLQVTVDPDAIARYGIPTRDVLTMVEAVGNRKAGEIREGQRRFPLAVRLPDAQRTDPDALAATLITHSRRAGGAHGPGRTPGTNGRAVDDSAGVEPTPHHRAMQRARAGCGRLRGGSQGQDRRAGDVTRRVHRRMGRPIREHGACQSSPQDHRADGAGSDLHHALPQPGLGSRPVDRGDGHPARGGGGHRRSRLARSAVYRECRNRVHCLERRCDPQRVGAGNVHPTTARG